MPLDLASLARKAANVEVDYAGETFAVTYRPHVYTLEKTAALQTKIMAVGDDERAGNALIAGMLTDLLVSWEVTEEGVPVPTTLEGLARFPMRLLLRIFERIKEDITDPNAQKTPGGVIPSSSGSSPAVLSVLRPTGTES